MGDKQGRLGTFAMVIIALTGCADSSLMGELGQAQMSYADWYRSCGQRCSLDTPLATGGRAWVYFSAPDAVGRLRIRAQDVSVVDVSDTTYGGAQQQITGLTEGETVLEVFDEAGVVDRFELEVRDVARVSGLPQDTLRVGAMGTGISLAYFDSVDRELRGLQPVEVEAPDFVDHTLPAYGEILDRISVPVPVDVPPRLQDWLEVSTDQSERPATVTLRAPGGGAWSFDVVAAAPVVDAVELTVLPSEETATVEAEITVANPGDDVRACCTWSVTPEDAGVGLNSPACETVSVFNAEPAQPNEAEVVCLSRGVESRVTVELTAGPP